ncbi:NAD-dependent epimerase/dehydratase family protein [Pediococcus claussenii]|uniref:Polysaccharide biosynthesis family protein n=1 Tax=Pediococcus claussenii (strain ATCC BAA-344 / DSM 14800 / JCM 18046 / KCTC 3811 / LMG 21948 / P06) TaxID=701521 RepID=G8PEW0_PEDCP|nr:NAD-dependent epimerase/dehydratase family protein [Pediococcus claussenii]AEV94490.1 polysaccharide biosynthesis family protein [Pediococcus claussenii ATCC BAA-344]ANZ69707.1 3-beta hydroxysteroid dehydrogenase [Pediococcus claussenii]ANZ71524.1 3-beta hydroxysteroid dehydrogenase [Pediococcus claussenii]KRN19804.1 hypothetical protein IV79_GL001092 [Pediococcus claussenii]
MERILVTGGSGFLGLHIIDQLLKNKYQVITTLRNLDKQAEVLKTLTDQHTPDLKNLSFVEANLMDDHNWFEAMNSCDVVMSVASPVFFGKITNESDALKPAVNGIQRILKFANLAKVPQVIMTSNFGAVGFSKVVGSNSVTKESDWTDEHAIGLSIYEKSKLLAEKAAWQYIEQPNIHIKLTTINPVAILGSSFNNHVSGSFNLLQDIISGKTKRIPPIELNVIDVSDVARLHVLAIKNSKAYNQRFIATAPGQISFQEIANLITNQRPEISHKITDKSLSKLVINLGAFFGNAQAREGKLLMYMNRNVSGEKSKELLNFTPQFTAEQAVLNAVDSLIKFKLT